MSDGAITTLFAFINSLGEDRSAEKRFAAVAGGSVVVISTGLVPTDLTELGALLEGLLGHVLLPVFRPLLLFDKDRAVGCHAENE